MTRDSMVRQSSYQADLADFGMPPLSDLKSEGVPRCCCVVKL